MSVIRLGSTMKFSEGWDNVFSGKKSKAAVASKPASGKRKPASKKVAKAKRGKK